MRPMLGERRYKAGSEFQADIPNRLNLNPNPFEAENYNIHDRDADISIELFDIQVF